MRLIYAIQHNKTKRIYVGCTSSFRRVRKHFQLLSRGKHHSKSMQSDYDTFGDDFSTYTIEIFSGNSNESASREDYWIKYFMADIPEFGYNDSRCYKRFKPSDFPRYDEKLIEEILN